MLLANEFIKDKQCQLVKDCLVFGIVIESPERTIANVQSGGSLASMVVSDASSNPTKKIYVAGALQSGPVESNKDANQAATFILRRPVEMLQISNQIHPSAGSGSGSARPSVDSVYDAATTASLLTLDLSLSTAWKGVVQTFTGTSSEDKTSAEENTPLTMNSSKITLGGSAFLVTVSSCFMIYLMVSQKK